MKFPKTDPAGGPIHAVVPATVNQYELLNWVSDTDGAAIRLLFPDGIKSHLRDRFPVNSKFKQLLENGDVSAKIVEQTPPYLIVRQANTVHVQISFSDLQRIVTTTDEELGAEFDQEFTTLFKSAADIAINVSPWEELLDSLEDRVGTDTRQEYVRLIEAAERRQASAIDEVAVAIIATAIAGGLQNDISKWGENNGVASAASFSRRKGALEADGVIKTEKVPIEVGRPKNRLQLGDQVGGLSMNIGIESREIDGSEPIERTNDTTDAEAEATSDDSAPQSEIDSGSAILDQIIKDFDV